MNKKEINVTEEELYNYYITQNHTWVQTVKDLDIPESFLRKCCNDNNWHKSTNIHNERIKKSKTTIVDVDKLKRLYIDENLTRQSVCEILGIKVGVFKRVCKENNITKDLDKIIANTNKTFLEKTGFDGLGAFSTTERCKNKRMATCIDRLGVPFSTQSESVKRKLRIANLRDRSSKGSNIGLSVEEVDEIVSCRDNFVNFIKEHKLVSQPEICDALGYSPAPIAYFIKKYDCIDLLEKCISLEEKEVLLYIKSLGVECYKDKTKIYPQEIDIYAPNYNIGIEFNGMYWHSSQFVTNDYHLRKYNSAKSKGIFIYHLFEDEWKNDKEKIKTDLYNLFYGKILLDKKEYIVENGKIPENLFIDNGYFLFEELEPTIIPNCKYEVYNAGYKHWVKI